jgi:hypothetical protein
VRRKVKGKRLKAKGEDRITNTNLLPFAFYLLPKKKNLIWRDTSFQPIFETLFGSNTNSNQIPSKRFWFIKKWREIRLRDPLATLQNGEGAKTWPGEWIIGGYKLTTMKIKIYIQQQPSPTQTRKPSNCNIAHSDMLICCSCCC